MSVTEPSEARKSTKSAVPPRAWKTSTPSSAPVSNRSPRFSVAFLAAARRVTSWTASSVSPASAAGVVEAAMASASGRLSSRRRVRPGTRKLVWRRRARRAAASYSVGLGKIWGSAQ